MHRVYGVDDRPGPRGDPFSHHPPPKAQAPLPEQTLRQQHTASTADAGLQAMTSAAGGTHLFVIFVFLFVSLPKAKCCAVMARTHTCTALRHIFSHKDDSGTVGSSVHHMGCWLV